MTGMERNSRVVQLGAYAPLFVHTSNRPWPTNMVGQRRRRRRVVLIASSAGSPAALAASAVAGVLPLSPRPVSMACGGDPRANTGLRPHPRPADCDRQPPLVWHPLLLCAEDVQGGTGGAWGAHQGLRCSGRHRWGLGGTPGVEMSGHVGSRGQQKNAFDLAALLHPPHPHPPTQPSQGTHYLPTSVVTNPDSPVRGKDQGLHLRDRAGRHDWDRSRRPPLSLIACPCLPGHTQNPLPALILAFLTQVHEDKVAASASCQDAACGRVALKLVNFSSYRPVAGRCLPGRRRSLKGVLAGSGFIGAHFEGGPACRLPAALAARLSPSSCLLPWLSTRGARLPPFHSSPLPAGSASPCSCRGWPMPCTAAASWWC